MTAEEKAQELFNKYADGFNFDSTYRDYKQQSKQCALIAVDEILNLCWNGNLKAQQYWQEVKQEIQKL
jgi:hypothetical protein